MLASDAVYVTDFSLDELASGGAAVLDEAERERAARFVFQRDRRRFVAAHTALRVLLGQYLDRPPTTLRFGLGRWGKPHLIGVPIDVRFNLSHAGERGIVAVAIGREVGVDIEAHRPLKYLELAGQFFATGEIAALHALPASERESAFFRCWTRKEALIKARGDGLRYPLNQFEVSLGTEPSRQLLRSDGGGELARWRIVDVPVDAGYKAALAAEDGDWRVVRWSGCLTRTD